jgi:nicotinamide-nucleotide amidase
MQILLPSADTVGKILKDRSETIGVAESSAGGLISASLLSVPGASAYFLGSAVFYTRKSMRELVGLTDDHFTQMHGLTEATALVVAHTMRERLSTTWAISEIGASGPTGSRYGDAAGTSAIAVIGPKERAVVIRTGSSDRLDNMQRFTTAALDLLEQVLKA